jgi:hypothetical protein
MNLPSIPVGFVPLNLLAFRGFHARAEQVAAVPGVVSELSCSSAYSTTFGPAAPPQGPFVQTLQNAAGWTAARLSLESYLIYVKSEEGLAWKAALTQMEQVKSVYDVTLKTNAQLPALFPALTRLLGVQSDIAKKSAAARKRTKAASGANGGATTSTAAAKASQAPTAAVSTANGGAAH